MGFVVLGLLALRPRDKHASAMDQATLDVEGGSRTPAVLPAGQTVDEPAAARAEPEQARDIVADLRRVVVDADQAQIASLRTLDASHLSSYYAGPALDECIAQIRGLKPTQEEFHNLEGQSFESVQVLDEDHARIELVEYWSAVTYKRDSDRCLWRTPTHAVPQTLLLERLSGDWKITSMRFHNAERVLRTRCDQ